MNLFTINGMNACLSSHSSSQKSTSIRRKKNISWENKTSGSSFSCPLPEIVIRRKKNLKAQVTSRYSIRPDNDVFYYREGRMRQQLGNSLYIRRSELIKELRVVYKASKSVCYLASINMLKHWLACYKVADTKRFLSNRR